MVRAIFISAYVLIFVSVAQAQLSPGDLHRVHAALEGVENCTKCHGGDHELVPDNCLACHGRIKDQRESGKGLHSRSEYQDCQNCHVEHQGRDFDLIHWKDGEKAFDHALTGFILKEKHAGLDCRKCHKPAFISGLALGENEQLDSSRTYLGLTTNCVSCHRDEHRGDLGANCTNCHTQTAWKPATGFDHSQSKFPLTGKHMTVACLRCHRLMTDRPLAADFDYLQYKGVQFANCVSCHTDTHAGKLGDNCSSCHNTDGWHLVNTVNFDHSKTRYPLEGRHVAVACAKCHQAGNSKQGLKFSACRDCHSDFHRGEFAKRASKGNCEECHSVQTFSPARFLMAQHEQTEYPLRGAHQAVPCLACHQRSSASVQPELRFVFESTKCQNCHKDPHRGQVDKLVAANGCETCHSVDKWNRVNYDHSKSNFALEGKHVQVACNKCHADLANTSDRSLVKFTGIRTDCQSCHKDIHNAQFAIDGATPCVQCHTAKGWKPSTFDHAKSRFALDGAHRNVACDKCHRPATDGSATWVTYKPLEMTCASCHGTANPERSKRS
ncbi:MAG: cytochrome C [bacterium]|nr:cytochrome C [bacterium]